MSLSPSVVSWRGLEFHGVRGAGPYSLIDLTGWDERPSTRSDSDVRPMQHGRFDGPVLSDERVVILRGQIISEDRDTLLAALDDAMYLSEPDAPTETLTVTRAGRTLTADARLTDFRTPTGAWAVGHVPFAAQWRCPDPLRYGPTENLTTGFATLTGGLEFDLFTDGSGVDMGWLDFGAAGSSGRVTVSNPGTAPAFDQFRVQGPVPPFEVVCVETGERLTFSRALGSGESLLIDSATGLVGLGESAVDYSGYLTRAEWFAVPAKGSCTIAFLPLAATDSGTLTVVHRPAWW